MDSELRWDLAFIGILGYLLVEYMRLPADYPVLMPLRLGKVVVGVALVGLLLNPGAAEVKTPYVRRIDIAVTLFLLVAFISSFFARYRLLAWNGFWDAARYGIIYFLIARIVKSPWRLRIFIFLLLLLNFKLAQHAIRYHDQLVQAYGEMVAVSRGGAAGSVGFFSNAADFGVAMCVVLPLAATLLFAKSQKRLMRFLLLAFSGTYLVSIFLCGSRGAVVGAAAIVLMALVKNPKKLMTGFMALIFLVGLIYILPGASKTRFRSALTNWRKDPTASQRIYLWEAGLLMFRDHPIFGVGIGNYPLVRLKHYHIKGTGDHPTVEHSIYIQVLAELGVAGTIPFLLLIFFFFRLNAQTRKQLLARGPHFRKSWEFCLAISLDLALVGYLASGGFVAVLFYPHLWVLLGVSVGLNRAAMQNHTLVPTEATIEEGDLWCTQPFRIVE